MLSWDIWKLRAAVLMKAFQQLQAPRTTYLPLLLQDIRKHLVDLVLDDAQQATLNPSNFWFDCNGEPLKWSVFCLSGSCCHRVPG